MCNSSSLTGYLLIHTSPYFLPSVMPLPTFSGCGQRKGTIRVSLDMHSSSGEAGNRDVNKLLVWWVLFAVVHLMVA